MVADMEVHFGLELCLGHIILDVGRFQVGYGCICTAVYYHAYSFASLLQLKQYAVIKRMRLK